MKSSIIAIETTEQMVDDEDFVQDNAEVTDFVNTHRGSDLPSAAGNHQQHSISFDPATKQEIMPLSKLPADTLPDYRCGSLCCLLCHVV